MSSGTALIETAGAIEGDGNELGGEHTKPAGTALSMAGDGGAELLMKLPKGAEPVGACAPGTKERCMA